MFLSFGIKGIISAHQLGFFFVAGYLRFSLSYTAWVVADCEPIHTRETYQPTSDMTIPFPDIRLNDPMDTSVTVVFFSWIGVTGGILCWIWLGKRSKITDTTLVMRSNMFSDSIKVCWVDDQLSLFSEWGIYGDDWFIFLLAHLQRNFYQKGDSGYPLVN